MCGYSVCVVRGVRLQCSSVCVVCQQDVSVCVLCGWACVCVILIVVCVIVLCVHEWVCR